MITVKCNPVKIVPPDIMNGMKTPIFGHGNYLVKGGSEMITVKYNPAKYKLVPLKATPLMCEHLYNHLASCYGYSECIEQTISVAPPLSKLRGVEVIE